MIKDITCKFITYYKNNKLKIITIFGTVSAITYLTCINKRKLKEKSIVIEQQNKLIDDMIDQMIYDSNIIHEYENMFENYND